MKRFVVFLPLLILAGLALTGFGAWQVTATTPGVTGVSDKLAAPLASAPLVRQAPTPTVVAGPAAVPVHASIPEAGMEIDIKAETMSDMDKAYWRDHPDVKPGPDDAGMSVYASSLNVMSWVSDLGSVPGDAQGTVYLTCHSSFKRDLPCNKIATDGSIKAGYHLNITMKNADGTTYIVSYVFDGEGGFYPKVSLTDSPYLAENPSGFKLDVCRLTLDAKGKLQWTPTSWVRSGKLA